jgi:hypothetical protein
MIPLESEDFLVFEMRLVVDDFLEEDLIWDDLIWAIW